MICSKNRKAHLTVAVFAILCAFGILLFCSKSSPLYPINDWCDANVYLTAGKGILKGMVMYRDLYDHKGPLIYMLHALCALISSNSFLGVFFLEIAAMTWALGNVYRMMKLYRQERFALVAMPLFALLICTSQSFSRGDSAEELSLPFIFCSLVTMLTYFKLSDDRMPRGGVILQGVLLGCVFWIKFTCIGLQAGLLLALLFRHIWRRQWNALFSSIGWILCGLLLSTLPWLVYFGFNGAIGDWLSVYLYDNLFRYNSVDGANLLSGIKKAVLTGVHFLGNNLRYTVLMLFGLCWIAFDSERFNRWECGTVWICALLGALFTFIGGKDYVYYGFGLCTLLVFGLIAFSQLLTALIKKKTEQSMTTHFGKTIAFSIIFAALCVACSPLLSVNVQNPSGVRIFEKKEDTMQYRFAQSIAKVPNATLLNYYFMDAGFYTAAGIDPSVKYYHYCNVPLEEMSAEQNRYVSEGLVDFVVTRGRNPDCIDEQYVLIDTTAADDPSWFDTVYLYVRKDLWLNLTF